MKLKQAICIVIAGGLAVAKSGRFQCLYEYDGLANTIESSSGDWSYVNGFYDQDR